MAMYLLLRNNKQSGPYSLEELKDMGMKAYDLVWLEGKSAAWRYPCELEELKEFAPAVEEQPFDRFYKKPAGTLTGTATTASSASNGNKDTTTIAFQPAVTAASSGESSVTTGKRIIYVTLPAGRPAPAPLRESPARETTREMPRESRETERPRISVPEPGTPVEFAPQRRSHSRERLIQILGVGLCILALLAAGIFIGLSLKKDTAGLQKRMASGTTTSLPAKPAVQPPAMPATNTAVPSNISGKITAPAGNNTVTSIVDDNARQANDALAAATGARVRKQRGKDRIPSALMPPIQKDSALAEIPVVTREAVRRGTAAAPTSTIDVNEIAKTALTSEVSVGANGYSVGTFGGINDLQLTVTNRTAHPLDLVVVEVKYIQANKKIYKTENLNFRDIGPGAALMQEAPKSSRGIRVQYRIISISSKELGLSYSGL